MKLDISNKEVLRAISHPLNLKKKDIEYLQSIALSNITGKSRICSHKNIEEKLHEMFIFHKKDYYVRPHRHFNKSESILILEGSADLVLFDEKGDIQNVIHLENFSSGNVFYHRIDEPIFHMIIIRSKFIVFYEATSGPFNRKDTEFAPWSPETNSSEINQFVKKIEYQIKNFTSI